MHLGNPFYYVNLKTYIIIMIKDNEFDLDIDNYSLQDLLLLLNLEEDFTEHDLRQSKKIVLNLHPDKSKLDAKYFLFYSKVYKLVYGIFQHKNKKYDKDYNGEEYDKNSGLDESIKRLLDKGGLINTNKTKDFNKKFNELFEKNVLKDNSNGYEDWFRNNHEEDNNPKIGLSQFDEEFEKRKTKTKSMIQYTGVQDMYANTGASFLDNDENTSSYSSELFSNFQYEDLKQAHNNSVIPVNREDYNNVKKYQNLDDLKKQRNEIYNIPKNHSQIIEQKFIEEERQANIRSYKLMKQMEENEKRNAQFLSEFMLLHN